MAGIRGTVSRTGYTGEDGFEVFVPPGMAPRLWDALLQAGTGDGLIPCGLGARDTLRLEAAMRLYGNDIDDTTTVLEADLKASEGRDFYDDEYFAAFGAASFGVLEQRTNDSISAVASIIAGAWKQAGRPAVPTELERSPRPIRRKP